MFERVAGRLSLAETGRLEALLDVVGPSRTTAFNRLKQSAGRASWSAFREQVAHMAWVDSLGHTVLGPSRDRREDARFLGSTFTDFLRRLAERPRMEDLLRMVDDQERLVLTSRFGLDRGSPRTISEVSEQLGLSETELKRVEKSALAKIRRAAEGSTGSE